MELKPEQIRKFIELNKDIPEFKNYSESEMKEIANGVANYYLSLFNIAQRIKREATNLNDIQW